MKPFDELFILELPGSVAGAYAAKLFADHGARVVKIEPAAGDPQRAEGEPVAGIAALFAAVNTGEESASLDEQTADGAAAAPSAPTSIDQEQRW